MHSQASETMQALLAKLPLWKKRLEAHNYVNFPILEEVLLQKDKVLSVSLHAELCGHLETLKKSFQAYFCSDELRVKPWVRNPFLVDMNEIDDSDLAKDDLIDLRTKEMLRLEFYAKELEEFWCSLKHSYLHLSKQAMRALIPFVTTYLCESGFSALVTIKTKNRNRLDIKHDMRVALSKTTPFKINRSNILIKHLYFQV